MSTTSPNPAEEGTVTHTSKKTLYTTTNPYEKQFGYHRAVRRGPFICVSGTTAAELVDPFGTSAGGSPGIRYPNDAFKQAQLAMQRCQQAVERLGGVNEDVIRVKMFVARSEDCGAVGEAFRAVFGGLTESDQPPSDIDNIGAAATMIVVPGGFVDDAMLVEVEVDAYCL